MATTSMLFVRKVDVRLSLEQHLRELQVAAHGGVKQQRLPLLRERCTIPRSVTWR